MYSTGGRTVRVQPLWQIVTRDVRLRHVGIDDAGRAHRIREHRIQPVRTAMLEMQHEREHEQGRCGEHEQPRCLHLRRRYDVHGTCRKSLLRPRPQHQRAGERPDAVRDPRVADHVGLDREHEHRGERSREPGGPRLVTPCAHEAPSSTRPHSVQSTVPSTPTSTPSSV